MAILLKIDGTNVAQLEDGGLDVCTRIRISDTDVLAGEAAFIWSHYSTPASKDGHLIALGVVTRSQRSDDRKFVELSIAVSPRPPLRIWSTTSLDALKKRGDGSPETEIADEVRGFTLDHAGHVSVEAAALMADHFA